MAEIIKKHRDLTGAVILGLIITVVGIVGMMGATSLRIPSVEAATSATATVAVSATVSEFLTFSVDAVNSGQDVNGASTTITTTDTTVPFGNITHTANAIGAHDLVVSTNAQTGYTVAGKYDNTLTSNGLTIADHDGTHGTPTTFATAGTEAYGWTTEDTDYSQFQTNLWAKWLVTDSDVSTHNAACSSDTIRVGYQVAIAALTEAATYYSTTTYTATGSY